MSDYETLHVCRVPLCQQCVKFWWLPNYIFKKTFYSIMCVCPKTCRHIARRMMNGLFMKLCMYVGYHDANNVSTFGGDPVTQYVLQYYLRCFTDMALHSSGGCYATTRRLQQYGRPYQPIEDIGKAKSHF